MAGPLEILQANRRETIRAASDVGVRRLQLLLKRSERDLRRRLREADGLGAAGEDTFTQAQLRITLGQVESVLRQLKGGMKQLLVGEAKGGAEQTAHGVVDYMRAAEKRYAGINERLPLREAAVLDRASRGAQSSVLHRLMGDAKVGPGILERYGDAVVNRFEERLQERFVARQPWAQVRDAITAESPFLQGAPAHWSERIVRTEIMGAHGRAAWEASREANEQLGDVVKILSATFDDRTGSDSIAVHGQIRRVDEAFQWWDGLYQAPPNRPNDREIVVSHRTSWPIPPELKWRSDGEVSARWRRDGRKGSPPPRPKMTTVPLERFGR